MGILNFLFDGQLYLDHPDMLINQYLKIDSKTGEFVNRETGEKQKASQNSKAYVKWEYDRRSCSEEEKIRAEMFRDYKLGFS